jgi:hypothetical protein
MQYMLLLYQETEFEGHWERASVEERRRTYAQFDAFAELAGERLVGGEELGISSTATTVRKATDDANAGADAVVTDGPFAEVAEQMGGYLVIEAADLDEAVELAKAAPARTVEVRPIIPYAEPS